MTVFGATYASAYDAIYAEKDYGGECDLIESLFERLADAPVRSVLDLGCGTGNHALPLSRRGYDVTGVDLSEEMLAMAREKSAREQSTNIRWLRGDLRSFEASCGYDAALLMFAVLGYQHANCDVIAALRNVRRHVRPGGLLLSDVWYGPAVIADPPAISSRQIARGNEMLTRHARGELDVRRHLCSVRYALSGEDTPTTTETHVVRYFFPMELELFLAASGFELLLLGAFDEPEREPGTRDRSAILVARAS